MVHGHVFQIKEADYQTMCCCCFKIRVARGGLGARKRTWRTKHNYIAVSPFHGFAWKKTTTKNNFNELERETAHCMHEKLDLWNLSEFFLFFEI